MSEREKMTYDDWCLLGWLCLPIIILVGHGVVWLVLWMMGAFK